MRMGCGSRGVGEAQDEGGAHDRVVVVGGTLVTEPERHPGAVGVLGTFEKGQGAASGAGDAATDRLGQVWFPGGPGAEGVGGDVRGAAIEGQGSPAAAEGWDTAITVLQVEQPDDAGLGGAESVGSGVEIRFEGLQGEQGAGGIVGVGHATGQVGPGPASGRGAGVRVDRLVLLPEQPGAEATERGLQGGVGELGSAEGLDREGGGPGGEVGVDGPAAVGADGVAEEGGGALGDGVLVLAEGREGHGDESGEGSGFEEAAAGRLE